MKSKGLLAKRLGDNQRSRFQKAQTEQFLRLLGRSYEQVLDVGCGKGYWSYVGAREGRFKACYGCDSFNDFQAKELKDYCQKVGFREMKSEKLPYESGRFDLVLSMDVIEHIEDDVFLIKEHLRVCKKGGEVIIGTPNYWRLTNILLLLLGRLRYPRSMGPDSYGDCIHLREYRMKELVQKTVQAAAGRLTNEQIEIFPCWIGVLMLSLGVDRFPGWLGNFCQFFFIKFSKNW